MVCQMNDDSTVTAEELSGWRKGALAGLPAPGIAPAVEAGNYHKPVLLYLEEYSVRKTTHSRPSPSPVNNGKLQGVFCDCFNRCLDCPRETRPKLRADVLIPPPRFFQVSVRLW
jgi:hypothetical protein